MKKPSAASAALLSIFLGAVSVSAQVVRVPVDVAVSGLSGANGGTSQNLKSNLTSSLPSLSAPLKASGFAAPKIVPIAKSAPAVIPSLSGPIAPSVSVPQPSAPSSDKPEAKARKAAPDSPLVQLRGIAEGKISFGLGILRPETGVTRLTLPKGVKLDRVPLTPEEAGAVAVADRFHLASDHALSDGSKPITLDADPAEPASIEKALRQLVDADPARFGASDTFGPASEDMAKVHVELLAGKGEQADSAIAVFRQWKKGKFQDGSPYYLLVDGANLRFHIKVLGGKPVVMAVEGGFAADIDPAVMTQRFSDDALLRKAQQRLQSPTGLPNGPPSRTRSGRKKARDSSISDSAQKPPKWLTRSLTFIENAWHALDLYQASDLKGRPVIVAVDVNSGKTWAFNPEGFRSKGFVPRLFPEELVKKAAKKAAPPRKTFTPDLAGDAAVHLGGGKASGAAFARGTTLDKDGSDHGPTGAMPLSEANVYDEEGNVLTVTAKDGSFTVPATRGDKPMTVVIKLDGIYGAVTDGDSQDEPLAARLTVLPGQTVKAVLNATGDNEQENANVNAYVYSYWLFDWFKNVLGLSDPRLYTPLAGGIHPNESTMPGNAYYSPDTDGFYLMKRATLKGRMRGPDGRPKPVSITFENTAQPSIILHELGHRFIQMASRVALTAGQLAQPAYKYVKNPMEPVVESGMNEAFADLVSMFIRKNPVLGKGFIIDGPSGMPTIIRTGDNTTQYDPNDKKQSQDPHARGEILMGTGWKSRQGFIERMGEVEGALYAAMLFVRTTLYVQPGDALSALMHALLSDMTKDGRLPNADIIRSGAGKHGLELPTPPGPPST